MAKQTIARVSYKPVILDSGDGEEFNTERLFPTEAEARAFAEYSIKHDLMLQLTASGDLSVKEILRVNEAPTAHWACEDGSCGMEELAAQQREVA